MEAQKQWSSFATKADCVTALKLLTVVSVATDEKDGNGFRASTD